MGILYGKYAQGRNSLSSRDLFLERSFYKHYVDVVPSYGPLDLWETRHHYGRADHKYSAIYLSEYNLKQIPTQRETIFALDFVTDAFTAFREEYKRLSLGQVAGDDSFFVGEFQPKRGWVSVHKEYHRHMTGMYNAFVGFINMSAERKHKMTNFDNFLKMFWLFIDTLATTFPVTRTGYIYSKYCNPRVSGLVLEIMKMDHDKDLPKEYMIEDINFGAYVATANKHGFYIDRNAPWRLVARIGSPKLEPYMNEYGITSGAPYTHVRSAERARDYNVDYFKKNVQIEDMIAQTPLPANNTAPTGLAGETSVEANHNHTYYVDANGNGYAALACHPSYQDVCHGHIIQNWEVMPASSKIDNPFSPPAPWGQNSVDPKHGIAMHIHNTLPPKNKPIAKEVRSYDNVFQKYYYESHLSDLQAIKTYALTFYNSYIAANPFLREPYSTECGNSYTMAPLMSSTHAFYKKSNPITKQEMDAKYSVQYWLRNYIHIRAKESKQDITEKKVSFYMKRINNLLQYKSEEAALRFIDGLFDGTIKPLFPYTKDPAQLAKAGTKSQPGGVNARTPAPNSEAREAIEMAEEIIETYHSY